MAKVTVYSTPACPWCVRLKQFLNDNNVEFEDVNVAEDREQAQAMIEKSGQTGVPVSDIGGEIVIGFDAEKLKELLNLT